ncbi:hypothetical protein D1646_08135 [Pseudoflavonifractor sp. 60]|uniref:hypothetical protein n=1 Tax=Pseudoflavonifractor sp. 60 TaxID=2304576 RepID=UPI00136D86C7|nr:hypothetical protein [Pseudoflavonifractor sp. 60]NBI66785.1 hypothetical protein [Pseudoflavonifractor sp. 60]
MTEPEELYESIARLKEKGVIVNTYNGTGDLFDPDNGALSDLIEYIYVWYSRNRPDWLEALYQVMTWQFETFHEGAGGYYENFYGTSPRELQVKTADYLRDNGYTEVEAQYRQGLEATVEGVFGGAASAFEEWMDGHEEAVWRFCLDVLEQHRGDWPEARKRDE